MDRAVSLAICAGGFVLTLLAGCRGFFAFDQSIILDGGWRILNGQVPFRDFITPHGVALMALQAAMFGLFGVSHLTYVTLAALLNAGMVALVLWIWREMLPRSPNAVGWGAACVTATWFHPPMGTPFSEQGAFFFGAAAIALLLRSRRSHRPVFGMFGVGLLAATSFLCKQNAAALLFAVLLLGVCIESGPRRAMLLGLGLGVGAATASWLGFLSATAGLSTFWQSYFATPASLLSERLDRPLSDLASIALFGDAPGIGRAVFVTQVLALLFLVRPPKTASSPSEARRAAGLSVSLITTQHLFLLVTNNEPANAQPFTGLGLGLVAGLVYDAVRSWPKEIVRGLAVVWIVVVTIVTVRGAEISLQRRLHTPLYPATFTDRIDHPGWRSLRWASPTRLAGAEVEASEVNDLLARLRQHHGPFFVFPDNTFLYAAVGQPSPQPLLWFDRGVSYPATEGPERQALDAWIVRSLERYAVDLCILETHSFGGTDERLKDFPELAHWIETEFEEQARIGSFRWLERREPGSLSGRQAEPLDLVADEEDSSG